MKIFLVGVACVGKTTIASLLAKRLALPFYDYDREVEAYYNTSLERLHNRYLTNYSYRCDTSRVLEKLLKDQAGRDFVCAFIPSGLMYPYAKILRQNGCFVVALHDHPAHIAERLTFYDIDSQPIFKTLSAIDNKLYMREIAKDISYFRLPYKKASLHFDISGESAEAAAVRLHQVLVESITI